MRIKTILAALAATAIAAPIAAQQFPTTPPALGTPKPFAVPQTESFRLKNGMQVTLVPYGSTPKTVVVLETYAGGVNEADKVWLANLAGEMMKQGAGGRDAAALATAAADMGGALNVAPGEETTTVSMNVLSERATDAVTLIAAVARRPDFPASEFERIKTGWQRRLALALSQPGNLANAALAKAYYGPDHPYGRSLPTAAQLTGYTLEETKAFHAANFGARRSHLYVAGRFDAAAMKAAIEAGFGDWAAGPERARVPVTAKAGPQVLLIDRPGAPQSTLRLAFAAPAAASDGDIRMRVSNALLGGSFSSRITRNIRENKGYTYSPGSGTQFWPGSALWTFQADVTTAQTGASLKEVFYEIKTLQDTAPPAEEVAGMRNYLSGLFVIQNATAPALVGSLSQRDSLGLPANWLQTYVPAVLAVTPAQVQAAAKETLPLAKMTLVVVGDLKTVEPQLKALPELQGATFQTVTVP